MDMFDLASTLFGNSDNPVAQGPSVTATGSTASADGVAGVTFDGDVTPADEYDEDGQPLEDYDQTVIDLPTSPDVLEGDEVIVTLVGDGPLKTPIVTANPGSGDRMAAAVAEAHDLAASVESIAQEAKSVAEATGQHFWPDTDGVHVTEVTQDEWNDSEGTSYHSGANVLINALGQLFRDGLNNLLALVGGSNPGVAIYDGTGNDAENVVASFTEDGATVGYTADTHVAIDSDSVDIVDGSTQLASFGINIVLGKTNGPHFDIRPVRDATTGAQAGMNFYKGGALDISFNENGICWWGGYSGGVTLSLYNVLDEIKTDRNGMHLYAYGDPVEDSAVARIDLNATEQNLTGKGTIKFTVGNTASPSTITFPPTRVGATGNTVSVSHNTYTMLQSVTLDPGIYLVVIGCYSAANSTGYRCWTWSSASSISSQSFGHTLGMAAANVAIYNTLTQLQDVSTRTTYHVFGWQNSGGALNMRSNITYIKLG